MTTKTKYTYSLRIGNKIYSADPNGLLHWMLESFKLIVISILLSVVLYNVMKVDHINTSKCFEENSHLTIREQRAICTFD